MNLRCCYGMLIAGALGPLSGCQPVHTDAADVSTSRWIFGPSAIANLSSARATLGVPEEIRLGDPFGGSALYLKFPRALREHGRAVHAFLTLTPSESASSDDQPIGVDAWRVKSDWQPDELRAWSDKPDLAPPHSSASIAVGPPHELRIDVTELVRFAARNPDRDFGVALLTRPGSGLGAAFSTGMAGGNAPRLELYTTGTR